MAGKLIEKQLIYAGKKVRLELHHLEDEDGARYLKEVCVHPGAVVVMAFLDDDTIVLIRNRRYAIGQTLIELPAGTLEPHEDPMNCAGRELVEETGYLADRLEFLSTYFTSPGVLSERMHAFAAYGLTASLKALEQGEEIEVMPTPWNEVIEMIQDGRIQDAKTIATVLMFEKFRRRGK
ncbi:MAG TPA: NUDIX hydrolase [Tepidisphaeraceae bacterium]|nr:NUDIX hydrolase [Tepidisphaeraceae bacterium]